MSLLERLPEELILHIASFLHGYSVLPLSLVSKHLSKITKDNELWKRYCLKDSHSAAVRKRLDFLSGTPVPTQDPAVIQLRSVALQAPGNLEIDDHCATATNVTSCTAINHLHDTLESKYRLTVLEQPNWYGEFVARYAPLTLSWLQLPPDGDTRLDRQVGEACGLGCFGDFGEHIVAPINDGSVCIWRIGRDLDAFSGHNGRVKARSKAGLLSANGPQRPSLPQSDSINFISMSNGIVECVSVDKARNKAYFAVHHGLSEVDLETLQLTSYHKYPATISVLSQADYPTPLTVGTTLSLHLHDPRVSVKLASSTASERLDPFAVLPSLDLNTRDDRRRWLSTGRPIFPTSSKYPYPLSILHFPSSHAVHVAGRCPSILSYDRRAFPKLASTTHSSANLCCLASSPSPEGNELVACGEYKSKGSLEIYRIPISSKSIAPVTKTINRASASSSKLLSVASHGTRLVFSDGDGMLKWVEKDGSTLVRCWNINRFDERESRQGIFGRSVCEEDNVVRKILPLHEESRSELAIWTGEKIGIVGFGKNPRFGPWHEDDKDEERKEEREMESLYGERMRRILERQADEVRFTRSLGLGF